MEKRMAEKYKMMTVKIQRKTSFCSTDLKMAIKLKMEVKKSFKIRKPYEIFFKTV
jgi:hypothetical protein